jgi:hypothetical protein
MPRRRIGQGYVLVAVLVLLTELCLGWSPRAWAGGPPLPPLLKPAALGSQYRPATAKYTLSNCATFKDVGWSACESAAYMVALNSTWTLSEPIAVSYAVMKVASVKQAKRVARALESPLAKLEHLQVRLPVNADVHVSLEKSSHVTYLVMQRGPFISFDVLWGRNIYRENKREGKDIDLLARAFLR